MEWRSDCYNMSLYNLKAMLGEAVPMDFKNWPCSQVWPLVQYWTIALQESSQEQFLERNGAAEVVAFVSVCLCRLVRRKVDL